MFPGSIEFLGRERDKERLQEAEHSRLVKIAANGKSVWFNVWDVLLLLLVIFVLTLAAVPILVTAAPKEINVLEAGYTENFAPCVSAEGIVLGREGGLLHLLNADADSDPVAAIVQEKLTLCELFTMGNRPPMSFTSAPIVKGLRAGYRPYKTE